MKRYVLVPGLVWALALLAGMSAGQEPAPEAPQPQPAAAVSEPPAPAPASEPVVPAPASEAQQVTVLQMIQWGGVILWVTMGLGFIGIVLSVYCLLTVTVRREAPPSFVRRVLNQIRAGDLRGAYQLCEGHDELSALVVRAGLKMAGHDRYVIQDAMESEGERGVAEIMQRISYLNNIGVIAPLLGLLGTVWGMVLAFADIAADNAQVRGIAVAEGVSKAMITTVGGLVVAIPCMVVYYYLRGRVLKIVAAVEAHSSEVVELLVRGHEE